MGKGLEPSLRERLQACEVDVDGAIKRLGNEELYMACLKDFLRDMTIKELEMALDTHAWDNAFDAAHALKGLAGNLGFVPLFHSAAEMVLLIRNGRVDEIKKSFSELMWCYRSVADIIRDYEKP